MQLLDYLPIIVVFISALVGIAGKTWDPDKLGLARLTLRGRCVIAIAGVSLGYGLFTVFDAHKNLDQRKEIALLAHREILSGIEHLLKPLCSNHSSYQVSSASIDSVFDLLRSNENLEEVGRQRLVDRFEMGGTLIANTDRGYFEVNQKYELIDLYIDLGSKLINDTTTKYAAYLSAQDAIVLETLLQDEFFVDKFRLSGKQSYFKEGLYEEKKGMTDEDSPWVTVGLHWFGAVYLKDKYRPGDYSAVLNFLSKAQKAANHISQDIPTPIKFKPCPGD